jgi:hypothetical protein
MSRNDEMHPKRLGDISALLELLFEFLSAGGKTGKLTMQLLRRKRPQFVR